MDNKRLIIGMAVALAVLLGWNYFIAYVGKKQNWKTTPDAPQVQQVQTPPAAGGPETVTVKGPETAPAGAAAGQAIKGLRVMGAPTASTAMLGSDREKDEQFSIGVRTQSKGASILAVTLNRFPKSLDKQAGPYVFQQPASSGTASMATLSATVNGQTIRLDDVQWALVSSDAQSALYEVELGADKRVLVIQKRIEIKPRSDGKTAGYEVLVRHSLVRSATGEPVNVTLSMAGPTTPPREIDRGPDRYILSGYNDLPEFQTPQIKPEALAIESLKEAKNLEKAEKGWPMIWSGLTSTYFDALVMPVGTDTHRTAPFIASVKARPFNTDKPTGDVDMVIETKPISMAEGNPNVDLDMLAFFGPKERAVVKNGYYGSYPRQYDLSLTTTGSCAWCTFQWLVDWMVWLLVAFHAVLRDWGLAIIALVVLVRALMHPLTRKSTISMHKMSKLAPEIERIKKKYADSPEEQQKAMMAFYKEHGAGQVLGCLPMFIQMPIWIALWSSLQSTFELRLAPFLWGFTWIKDLSKPDQLITFPGVNLFFFELNALNILPIAMAVVFFLQQKFTPQQASMTPEQEQQQKMMKWMMTLMFPIMLYNGPSGLNLYIFTSTLVGILESKWIRDHIRAREAAQAASGPVIIDAPATRAARRRQENEPIIVKPKGRFAQWWERVQRMAADAQKQQQTRKKK